MWDLQWLMVFPWYIILLLIPSAPSWFDCNMWLSSFQFWDFGMRTHSWKKKESWNENESWKNDESWEIIYWLLRNNSNWHMETFSHCIHLWSLWSHTDTSSPSTTPTFKVVLQILPPYCWRRTNPLMNLNLEKECVRKYRISCKKTIVWPYGNAAVHVPIVSLWHKWHKDFSEKNPLSHVQTTWNWTLPHSILPQLSLDSYVTLHLILLISSCFMQFYCLICF